MHIVGDSENGAASTMAGRGRLLGFVSAGWIEVGDRGSDMLSDRKELLKGGVGCSGWPDLTECGFEDEFVLPHAA